MPDLLNFSIARAGSKSMTVPTWTISGQIVDSSDQTLVLRDFTGANSVSFPQVLGNLTAAQQDEMIYRIVNWLLEKRFGVS